MFSAANPAIAKMKSRRRRRSVKNKRVLIYQKDIDTERPYIFKFKCKYAEVSKYLWLHTSSFVEIFAELCFWCK